MPILQITVPSDKECLTTKMFVCLQSELEKTCPEIVLKINYFGSGPDNLIQGEELPGIREGKTGGATYSTQDISKYIKGYEYLAEAYAFENFHDIEKAYAGPLGERLKKDLEDKFETVTLCIIDFGTRILGLSTDKEIQGPQHVKDLRLRLPKGEEWKKSGESLGVENPVQMRIDEVIKAFQENQIDGQENPLTTVDTKKFAPYLKQFVFTNHRQDWLNVGFSLKFWNQLTEPQKEAFKTALLAAKRFNDEERRAHDQELIQKFQAMGIRMSYPDIAPFREHAKAYYAALKS